MPSPTSGTHPTNTVCRYGTHPSQQQLSNNQPFQISMLHPQHTLTCWQHPSNKCHLPAQLHRSDPFPEQATRAHLLQQLSHQIHFQVSCHLLHHHQFHLHQSNQRTHGQHQNKAKSLRVPGNQVAISKWLKVII
jgi:hypothetical protein